MTKYTITYNNEPIGIMKDLIIEKNDGSATIKGTTSRVLFDKTKLQNIFTANYSMHNSQILPFDIEILNNETKESQKIVNAWITGTGIQYNTENQIILSDFGPSTPGEVEFGMKFEAESITFDPATI